MDESRIPFDKPLDQWHETEHFHAAMWYAERGNRSGGAQMERNRWAADFHLRAAQYLANS
jgi:hypothetical protein